PLPTLLFFLSYHSPHPNLHSFPTRRSSDLRPLLRLLHRSDREEAAQSLSPRHAGALLRHGRLQPDLQVLPELGHFESARARPCPDRKSTRLNSSHVAISYAVFCLKKKKTAI